MGQAKSNRQSKERFLKEHPYCCFCGGTVLATTTDHVPSIQMFTLRQRPKGLEVPACQACNNATRQHEQVAAMLGRVYPEGTTEAERAEIEKIMHAVNNNNPGLMREMFPSRRQELRFQADRDRVPADAAGVLSVNGPLLNKTIQAFGAKLGFALHYAHSGRIVPREGGVAVRWYSNHDALTGRIPEQLFKILGSARTLQQGRWNVADQFNYSFGHSDNGNTAAYFSTFRKSFAVLSWVSLDSLSFEGGRGEIEVHRPGRWTVAN